jgi:hypothetical protein
VTLTSRHPTNASPNTVTVKLFFENSCCHPIETANIGQFNKCHNSNRPFTTLKQAVGANLFDQGLHIIAFAELDCLGPQAPANGISLTNNDVCAPAGNTQTFLSFMVAEPPTCSIKTTNDSPNTVTLDLYSAFGCCSSIETIKVGNLDVCHDSNAPFHSLSEAVGANMFGWLYQIHPYTGAGCSGDAGDPISLSNSAPNCYENGIAWQSFKVSQTCNNPTESERYHCYAGALSGRQLLRTFDR